MSGQTRHWSESTLAVFDCETTGLDTAKDRMVQAAFLFVSPVGEVLPGGYETVINPGIKVPDKVVEFHGITTARIRLL